MTSKIFLIIGIVLFFGSAVHARDFKSIRVSSSGVTLPESGGITRGIVTLSGGTLVVNTTAVKSTSWIMLTPQSGTLNLGSIGVSTRVEGTSFTILSTNVLDARDVAWIIFDTE